MVFTSKNICDHYANIKSQQPSLNYDVGGSPILSACPEASSSGSVFQMRTYYTNTGRKTCIILPKNN